MNRFIVILFLFLFVSIGLMSQMLDIKTVSQEQNQWCWVAVSKCVMDYYGIIKKQCEIAEYTRNVSSWHDFGEIDCCLLPTGKCNYMNYFSGGKGSVNDILSTFGNIQNSVLNSVLGLDQIAVEFENCRPFIMGWNWTSGGAHALVGYGKTDATIYYMDPWKGEGFKASKYNWLLFSKDHTWTSTIKLITSPTLINSKSLSGPGVLLENPANTNYSINSIPGATEYEWKINPSNAGIISGNGTTVTIDFDNSYIGLVFIYCRGYYKCRYSNKDSLLIRINPIPPVIRLDGNMLISNSENGNQWYFNDMMIPNATEQFCQVTKRGKYYSILNINSCCSEPSNIIYYGSTDIQDNNFLDKIYITPNPSSGLIKIKIPEIIKTDYIIEIYNAIGNIIQVTKFEKTQNDVQYDLSQYSPGLYVVRIIDEYYSISTKIIRNE